MGIESPKLSAGFIFTKEICTLVPKIFLRMIFPAVRKPVENQRRMSSRAVYADRYGVMTDFDFRHISMVSPKSCYVK